jgi:capsular polysaccharide biosynthesis protein
MDDRMKTTRPEEVEIDLLELATVILHKFWLVIIGLVVGAAAAFAVVNYAMTPKYKSTATIYIFSKTTSITSLADLQIGSQLTEDFQIIAKTRDVVEKVIYKLDLDTSYEALVNHITVTNPASSHMLQVTVEDTDPEQAAKISNALSDELRDQISEIMNTDKPSVVQRASVPKAQSSPSVRRDTVIGAILGALLVMVALVIRHLSDDTIKISDDVHKYLGLDVLAEFPYIRERGEAKGKGGRYDRHAAAGR